MRQHAATRSFIRAALLAAALAGGIAGQAADDKRVAWAPGAPATDLASAYAFPVPFKPSLNQTRITFTNLSSEATIRIYSRMGDLVKTLHEEDGDGILRWDVTNEQGQPVGSEVYVYVISNAEQVKVGKLLVVR